MNTYLLVCALFALVAIVVIPISYHMGRTDSINIHNKSEASHYKYASELETKLKETQGSLLRMKEERDQAIWMYKHTWDYELMARLVESEAEDQSFAVKVMVANVILNRVAAEEFPNTVMDVMVAKNQFTPICDGTAYENVASAESYAAIDEALSLSRGNEFFFINPDLVADQSYYDNDLRFISRHGGLNFYGFRYGDKK